MLEQHIAAYLASLARENASPHTIASYGSDLREWLAYLTPPEGEPPDATAVDALIIREWLGHLYDQQLEATSIRRKLAAVRSFFKYLERARIVSSNPAKLVRTPKAPARLPKVPSVEVTNGLIDSVTGKAAETERPHPERDLALFEFLYGCGLRVSELVGLNVTDIDRAQQTLLVRGKGKKERQVPFGGRAAAALMRYLEARTAAPGEPAVFVNHRGTRLTDRGARAIVRFYSQQVLGDPSVHPHTLRHAYGTHLLASGADLRAIQELLGHARLSTTQKYTQVALTELMAVYDKCHPKA